MAEGAVLKERGFAAGQAVTGYDEVLKSERLNVLSSDDDKSPPRNKSNRQIGEVKL